MRFWVRLFIVVVWVAAVPGCLFVSAPIYRVVNADPHSRDGAEEFVGGSQSSGFYMMAWLPGSKTDNAHVILERAVKGEVVTPQDEGTLRVNKSELDALNAVLSRSIAERTAHIEIVEESESGQTLKLSVADEGGVGAHMMYVTSWYQVSPDGRNYVFLARKVKHANILLPFFLATLMTFGLAGLISRQLKKSYLETNDKKEEVNA